MYRSYGGVSDTWGLPFTPANINASFKANIRISSGATVVSVDHVRVTVYYTDITQVSVSGSQPSATGAVSAGVRVAGNQPAPSGSLAAHSSLARTTVGDQPAASGALAPKYLIGVAGNQPGASGGIAAARLQKVEGAQPAASGSLASIVQPGDSGTVSVNSSTADGYITSTSGTYSTARAGASLSAHTDNGSAQVAQASGYACYEAFFDFDTSAIPAGATITAVALKLYGVSDNSTTDSTIEARAYDWGASLTTADWIAGADLGNYPLVATLDTSGFTTSGYNTFSENGSNFRNAINKTGVTRIVLNSDRHRAGTTPTTGEQVYVSTADEADSAKRPLLEVTYVTAPKVRLGSSQPAATGTVTAGAAVKLEGDQPAATGGLSQVQYKTLEGAQPAPSGSLTPLALQKTVEGVQPAPSGALTFDRVLSHVALAGNQPNATGFLVVTTTTPKGNQPAPSGALRGVFAKKHLTGEQPGATGALLIFTLITLAGTQPAASGELVVRRFAFAPPPAGSARLRTLGGGTARGQAPQAGAGRINVLGKGMARQDKSPPD